jgi:hypothetical protein
MRLHEAFGLSVSDDTLDATLNVLMMQSEQPDRPQETTDLPDRPAISALVRPGSPAPFAIALSISTLPYPHSKRQFNRPPPRCHDLTPSLDTPDLYRSPRIKMNPPL